ncbi:MAG: hypothetical protein ACR2PG_16065 [Hyphomicrobiaceae bacterium]
MALTEVSNLEERSILLIALSFVADTFSKCGSAKIRHQRTQRADREFRALDPKLLRDIGIEAGSIKIGAKLG